MARKFFRVCAGVLMLALAYLRISVHREHPDRPIVDTGIGIVNSQIGGDGHRYPRVSDATRAVWRAAAG